MEFKELWSATDEDKIQITLDKILTDEKDVHEEDFYQINLDHGPFSGYPTVDVTKSQLKDLLQVLIEELGDGKEDI